MDHTPEVRFGISHQNCRCLIRILPVTNSILELHFSEGHIDYNGIDANTGELEAQTDNVVYLDSKISINAVTDVKNYTIRSEDDGSYSSPKSFSRSIGTFSMSARAPIVERP